MISKKKNIEVLHLLDIQFFYKFLGTTIKDYVSDSNRTPKIRTDI